MLFVIFILGLAIGSFANVLIDRLPKGENVLTGRSHCDWCKKTLRWYELIPLLSFIFQRGRCRRCHKKLSFQYPVIELFCGISLVILYTLLSYSLILLFAYFLIFLSFLVIFIADLKYQIIPDSMLVTGVLGVIIILVIFPLAIYNRLTAGLGTLIFFYLLYRLTKGRGIGFGDVKLSLILGLITGYPGIIVALYAAFLTGAATGVILILGRHRTLKSRIAFGPFLITGTVFSLAFGAYAWRWFMNLL